MEPIENTSGMGKQAVLPRELNRWNWGAFFLNWIWGIGNSTYIALLMFIPLVNLVMIFLLGMNGNRWAWQNRAWRDVEHFRKTQRAWGYVGGAIWFIVLFIFFPLLFMGISNLLKGEAYQASLNKIRSNSEVVQMVGKPIEPGYFVMGSIKIEGGSGSANINYSIKGPKGSAQVYLEATKQFGTWTINNLVVVSDQDPTKRVIVVGDGKLKSGSSV